MLTEDRQQGLIDERALTTPRYPSDTYHSTQWEADIDTTKVIATCARQAELTLGHRATLGGDLDGLDTADIACRQRASAHHSLGRTREDDLTTEAACLRPHIDDMVCLKHHILVMLDDDDGIPQITELLQRMDEAHIVSLVEANARLIEDIEYLDQLGTDLRRQANTLALAP